MTSDMLAGAAGIVLSLLMSYVPGLRGKWAELDDDHKQLWMLVLLAVCAGAVFVGSCTGIVSYASCDRPGALGLAELFVTALIANQAAHRISPALKD